jgi:hypothetical protein
LQVFAAFFQSFRTGKGTMTQKGRLLRGANAIAFHVFGNKGHARSVYRLTNELGLFRLGGQIVGYEQSIDAKLNALERAGPKWRKRHEATMEAR